MKAIDPLNPYSQPSAETLLSLANQAGQVDPGPGAAGPVAIRLTDPMAWHAWTGPLGDGIRAHSLAGNQGGPASVFFSNACQKAVAARLADRFADRSGHQIAGEAASIMGLDDFAVTVGIQRHRLENFILGAELAEAATIEAASRRIIEERRPEWPPALAEVARHKPLARIIVTTDEDGREHRRCAPLGEAA